MAEIVYIYVDKREVRSLAFIKMEVRLSLKYLGKISDEKDLVTKEYTDDAISTASSTLQSTLTGNLQTSQANELSLWGVRKYAMTLNNNLKGSSSDTSDSITVQGTRKYASEQAKAEAKAETTKLLGEQQDVPGLATVYGALAQAGASGGMITTILTIERAPSVDKDALYGYTFTTEDDYHALTDQDPEEWIFDITPTSLDVIIQLQDYNTTCIIPYYQTVDNDFFILSDSPSLAMMGNPGEFVVHFYKTPYTGGR